VKSEPIKYLLELGNLRLAFILLYQSVTTGEIKAPIKMKIKTITINLAILLRLIIGKYYQNIY
jgi:hypothetical protein